MISIAFPTVSSGHDILSETGTDRDAAVRDFVEGWVEIIHEDNKVIVVITAGTREIFYKELIRYMRNM